MVDSRLAHTASLEASQGRAVESGEEGSRYSRSISGSEELAAAVAFKGGSVISHGASTSLPTNHAHSHPTFSAAGFAGGAVAGGAGSGLYSFPSSTAPTLALLPPQHPQPPTFHAPASLVKTSHHLALPPTEPLHNLIPSHLQSSTLESSLNGTPGHPSAIILGPKPAQFAGLAATTTGCMVQTQPTLFSSAATQPVTASSAEVASSILSLAAATTVNHPAAGNPAAALPLTVQDRPMTPPVYNGVNPNYPGLRVLNNSPPIFCVENFLTPYECDFLIQVAQDSFGPAPVVGKGVGEVSPSRTSSTCYLAREDVPDLMRKVSLLTGKPVEHSELPQVGRYFSTQQYLQHFDAFDLSNEDGRRFAANGGQRTITVLIYLNDVRAGGATRFPALDLQVQPVRGMALVFFPATVDGLLDKMALHAALPAVDTKYVSQVWIRQSTYNGQPSKRLPATLGVPFGQEATAVTTSAQATTAGAAGHGLL